MISFDQEICGNLEKATAREWLETNGLGGFASSTIIGLNTRRYHALLVAATKPPVGRMVLLSKIEETLVINGQRHELSANHYPGTTHPQGFQFLKRFRLDPFPVFTYEIGGIVLEKSVFMLHRENSTVIQYRLLDAPDDLEQLILETRPLVAFRDYHSTTHRNDSFNSKPKTETSLISIAPYETLPTLFLAHNADSFDSVGCWYHNFEYHEEQARGLDFTEDLYNSGTLTFDLSKRNQANIVASTEAKEITLVEEYKQREIARRQALTNIYPQANNLIQTLLSAADQFIVARGNQKSVIAGYHWFSDWGRDTMIALQGLTLVTGRHEIARDVLLSFAEFISQGMLPNRFPDAGEEPEYNTVDATLWYFDAVHALVDYTDDYDFVRQNLYEKLIEIIDWHERGTRYGIKVDADGLLHAGESGVQLTWMDARIGDWVVTPRTGKAVEIQSLWYNALCIMEKLANEFADKTNARRFRQMAQRCKQSFNQLFWNAAANCLYDVVDGETYDASLRPNQILAVSLKYSMLNQSQAKKVVAAVQRELLTPLGLRSLATSDPRYQGRYEGGPRERDAVYHQGTVWTWLIGPFITAYVKTNKGSSKSRQQAALWLEEFEQHLNEAGIGQVSEIFDGDAPHKSRGCIAQAWSVAELLRAAIEDVYKLVPLNKAAMAATLRSSAFASSAFDSSNQTSR